MAKILELINATSNSLTIPRPAYQGNFVVPSGGREVVNAKYMRFYAPYRAVGLVVRYAESNSSSASAVTAAPDNDAVETAPADAASASIDAVINVVLPEPMEALAVELSTDSADEGEAPAEAPAEAPKNTTGNSNPVKNKNTAGKNTTGKKGRPARK